MTELSNKPLRLQNDQLPFPAEWLHTNPDRAETALNALPLGEQARCVLQLSGRERQDLLLLCRQAETVAAALPPEEIYLTLKDIGEDDALPLIGVASPEQVQIMFDLECWSGDKFLPDRAWQWLALLDKANDRHVLNWFQSGDFEEKVTFLQSLIKVFKRDEMTDQYENVDQLTHWSPDGVYDLFFKIEEAVPVIKRVFIQMISEDAPLFGALMEAVIWWPVTPTLERAWQLRLMRTAERGVPEFEEAFEVYSLLDPEALKVPPARYSEIESETEQGRVAPRFPLQETDPSTFLGQCLALMKNADRFDAICWELMVLSNKVLVADRQDMGDLESRRSILRKALGYINLGLELGAGGDIGRGEKLLHQTWMQSLFQVGYAALMRLKWDAEQLLREKGGLVKKILDPVRNEHLLALLDRFPKIGIHVPGDDDGTPEVHWRDLQSQADLDRLQSFIDRLRFEIRFVTMVLELSESELEKRWSGCRFPQSLEDLDTTTLVLTAFAHHALFGTVNGEPLDEEAAQSFLKMVFLPSPYPDEDRVVDPDLLEPFRTRLLEHPMAWTETDRASLEGLLAQMVSVLIAQFGRVNAEKRIDWHFTRGLWIR